MITLYTVITRPRTYEEAVKDCEALDLQLTRLLTVEHTNGLIEALKNKNLEGQFYIGLSRNETMPEFFQWVDGQSIHGDGVYSGWENGHPTLDASCGYIETQMATKGKGDSRQGRWKSAPCEEQKNYVCGKTYHAVPDCPLGLFTKTQIATVENND